MGVTRLVNLQSEGLVGVEVEPEAIERFKEITYREGLRGIDCSTGFVARYLFRRPLKLLAMDDYRAEPGILIKVRGLVPLVHDVDLADAPEVPRCLTPLFRPEVQQPASDQEQEAKSRDPVSQADSEPQEPALSFTEPEEPGPSFSEAEEPVPHDSDEALALKFAKVHSGDLRYVAAWGKWLSFDGSQWQSDDTLFAFSEARRICRSAGNECNELKQGKALASAKNGFGCRHVDEGRPAPCCGF